MSNNNNSIMILALKKVFLFSIMPLICISMCGASFAADLSIDDHWYRVSSFNLTYQYQGQGQLPTIDELMNIEICLSLCDKGYQSSDQGDKFVTTLAKLNTEEQMSYHVSAIKSIQDQLVRYFNDIGIGGVVVMPSAGQIDMTTMDDLRKPVNGSLFAIDIWVARVVSVKANISLSGKDNSVTDDHKYKKSLARVKKYSPIKANVGSDPNTAVCDILKTAELEDYLYKANRHPGRRVDAAVGPADKHGDVKLDYNVRQNKPWLAYMQLSNTGSRDTSDFRHRFGLVNNQLTGNDDIFNLDYLTTDFNTVNSLATSYDRPWFDSEDTRYKLWLNWSDYVSSEIGSISYFSGGETTVGFELTNNCYQRKRLFIDRFAGLRLSRYRIRNFIIDDAVIEAGETFIVPRIGYRLEYDSGIKRTMGEISLEANISGNNSSGMQNFGRLEPDSGWVNLGWNLSHSFYLEPILDPEGWKDINTPKSSTLAHEISFTTRGQLSPNRLIPQEKFSVGGLYSVRGYRQGYCSGDSVVFMSGEYRYHIPRAFDISKPAVLPLLGKKFRWAPEQVYGFPDWDLIFRTFIDGAMVYNNDRRATEDNYSLLSGGVGVELQFNRYFSLRCDWGVALHDVVNNNGDRTDVGDSAVHISGMLAY